MTRRKSSALKRTALAIGVLLMGGGIYLYSILHSGLPQRNGELVLPELQDKVRISYDGFGVPAIYAKNSHDLAMAMGWVHANDRMEQMELSRLAIQGRLAEALGPSLIEADLHLRHMRIPHTAHNMISYASEDSMQWLNAYAIGVNAWLEQRKKDLPPFYQLTGWQPEPWQVRDSLGIPLVMAMTLSQGFGPAEEQRLQTLQGLGADRYQELWGDTFIGEGVIDYPFGVSKDHKPNPDIPAGAHGSNNWVVNGSRTQSGAPILANDPHLNLELPSVWYQVLISCPDFKAAGMGFPGVPAVVIGHNDYLAWGFTNSQLDDNDIYLEKFNEDRTAVLRDGNWVAVKEEVEMLKVKGEEAREIILRSTDRGPLLPANAKRNFAERTLVWTAYLPYDPSSSFIGFGKAKTIEEASSAAHSFLVPSQNILMADRSGKIAHIYTGQLPHRAIGDGRIPYPGWETKYDWQGLWPRGSGANRLNPENGILATANHDTRPDEWKPHMSGDFGQAYRHQQIFNRLSQSKDWTAQSMTKLQSSNYDGWADDICTALADFFADAPLTENSDAQLCLASLIAWDKHANPSTGGKLFRHFRRKLAEQLFGDWDRDFSLPQISGFFRRPHVLAAVRGELVSVVDLRRKIVQALENSWRHPVEMQLNLKHPLSNTPIIGNWWNRGPFNANGSPTSIGVMAGPIIDGVEQVRAGPSFRMVCDLGDWDNSLLVLPGGQSSHPADPHYSDQVQILMDNQSRPFNYSDEAVQKAQVSQVILRVE